MKFLKRPLMAKLVVLSAVATTILGLGSLVSMNKIARAFNERLLANFEFLATVLGDNISSQFHDRYLDAKVFAETDSVRNLKTKSIPIDLNLIIKNSQIYDLLVVVDKDGRYVASNTNDPMGKIVNSLELAKYNYAQTPWFKSVIANSFSENEKKNLNGVFFEDFHLDPLTQAAFGEFRVTTGFSAPIKNSAGETIGVLSSRANERWVQKPITDMLKSMIQKDYRESHLYLVGKGGHVLIEASHEFPNGTPGTKTKSNLGNDKIYAAIQAVKATSGADFFYDQRKDTDIIAGFEPLDNRDILKEAGWSVVVSDTSSDALKKVNTAMNTFYFIFGSAVFIAMAFSLLFAMILTKAFNKITETLTSNSKEVDEASKNIAQQATEISLAATDQSMALQETVAAVDEINATIEKNAEAANRSIAVSSRSRTAAEYGRKIVADMIVAISDIDQANREITDQMNQSNRQLSDITRLVNDIGTKTRVINEIVFQTKLLSFNASVEAARAGEYGKGFSVVAEEVGNLARMSGNAAKEITTLLEESVRKVEAIVTDSKGRVDRLTAIARDRVSSGSATAKECNQALEEIIKNVQSVDTLISEIAIASQQQSTGIQEISRAVSEMEAVTEQHSAAAHNSSLAAENLKTQSRSLSQVVQELISHVRGQPAGPSTGSMAPVLEFKVSSNKVKRKMTSTPIRASKFKRVVNSDAVPSADDPGFNE